MAHQTDHYRLFIELYSRHSRQVHSYLCTILPNLTDVDDVYQEVSLVLWEKFDEFEMGSNFLSWAKKIAYYKTLHWLRTKRRSRIQFSTDFINTVTKEVEKRQATLDEQSRLVSECLKKLRQKDRDLLLFRYSTRQTIKEVAKQICRPVGAVYKSLARIEEILLLCVRSDFKVEETAVDT